MHIRMIQVSALTVLSGLVFALPADANPRAWVPQIAYSNSAYVQQLPRNARPWVKRETPAPAPVSAQTANATAARQDFVLDFGARQFEMRLPSVREGIRVVAR